MQTLDRRKVQEMSSLSILAFEWGHRRKSAIPRTRQKIPTVSRAQHHEDRLMDASIRDRRSHVLGQDADRDAIQQALGAVEMPQAVNRSPLAPDA